MEGSLGLQPLQDPAVNELPEYKFEVLDGRPAGGELEEGEIDPGNPSFVIAQDTSFHYLEQVGQAAYNEQTGYGDASVRHEAEDYYREGTYPTTESVWPPQASQEYRSYSSHSYAAPTGDACIAEQTWPGPSQGQVAEGYGKYDESYNYSREGDQSSYPYSTPAANLQEAHAYDYSAYYDHGYRHTGYGTEAHGGAAGFTPFESPSVPADRQPQQGVSYCPAPNVSQSVSLEETALKTEPTKKTIKKPDKSKFVLSKNKPIVQPNFLPKLSSGAITKPRPKKVELKYEAEMRKYQAMA